MRIKGAQTARPEPRFHNGKSASVASVSAHARPRRITSKPPAPKMAGATTIRDQSHITFNDLLLCYRWHRPPGRCLFLETLGPLNGGPFFVIHDAIQRALRGPQYSRSNLPIGPHFWVEKCVVSLHQRTGTHVRAIRTSALCHKQTRAPRGTQGSRLLFRLIAPT
jgi:hypothetical protein